MADEPNPIVVPLALAHIVMLATQHHKAMKALDEARSLLNDANALCKDCDGNMSIQIEREDAATDALVSVLDLRCPCSKPFGVPRRLTVLDLMARSCPKCGAKIIIEGASHE